MCFFKLWLFVEVLLTEHCHNWLGNHKYHCNVGGFGIYLFQFEIPILFNNFNRFAKLFKCRISDNSVLKKTYYKALT